ncbi:hypothetical protein [Jannaschia sp. CCS1]|uniref:hypothetical protein n=1 Tax=Jannaschia sp. (strain CCS1) TaxID=290400 RepID=UPI00140F802D|nr:hypothetical protein [Jannaschia sp. CCS1]
MTAAPAFAQSAAQEARFADAMRAMEAQTFTFYTTVDPRFEQLLTPVADNPAYRESQRCVLARIEDEGGSEMLEEYIAAMEVQGDTEITSLIDLAANLPDVMISDLIFAASTECGPMSFTTDQMATSEFTELMADPAIMQGLMGE